MDPRRPAAVAGGEQPPRFFSRDRAIILAGLGLATAGAWAYLVLQSGRMTSTPDGMTDTSTTGAMGSMLHIRAWTLTEFGVRLSMWAVMMAAMMLPSAVPMTLIYAAIARKALRQRTPLAPGSVLVAGYIVIWLAFSVAATLVQWSLERMALLSPMMVSRSPLFGSLVLVGVGIYQLTPLKQACLKQCRDPAHLFSRYWRTGPVGAFRLGSRLGIYCLGCCWILMALLFVGGVMNLLWIAAIATFIVLEKTVPFAEVGGRVIGGGMVVLGLAGATGSVALL
jgi:predicted metal-binding membrane protein